MRIAHISDVHLLDDRARHARYRFATKLVSLGQRAIDPLTRRRRLARALAMARAGGADHVVVSGDLTEVGDPTEFEAFAEVLHEAKLPEHAVTLVPGNHDAYTPGNPFAKAMQGPLARFASGSAGARGHVVDRGPVAFLPLDTTVFNSLAWSGGLFTKTTAETIERKITDPGLREKAIVLVVHHPPFHPIKAMKWIDGLRGGAIVLDLLARHPRLQLLHGHLHRIFNHIVASGTVERSSRGTRLFGAPAICDGPDEAPAIRFYDVRGGALVEAA